MKSHVFDIPVMTIKKGDKKYPKQLYSLVDPPEELHVRGTFEPQMFTRSLAVVGSRKMTPYGRAVVDTFVKTFAVNNIVIVSGFMYGIDTAAHWSAIKARGRTVAVLGNGLNHIYPTENEQLYAEIVHSGGCLISEYPDGFTPQKWTFPNRNRIVAALCSLGTLIVEAAESSGSLITASYADALNRPLFAVPGPIFSETSKGVNQLIKDNLAQMVMRPEDIMTYIRKTETKI